MRRNACVLAVAFASMAAVSVTSQAGGALLKRPPTLPAQARTLAAQSGYNHAYGGGSARLKQVTAQLIRQVFRPAGPSAVARALCFARRESGLNPVAISTSDDHGAFQVNRPTHPQFNYWLMDHDPAYGVEAGWSVSSRGRDWGPWAGGAYPC